VSAAQASAASLAVDWTRCDGHGLCAQLLPERIVLDEWGFPMLREAPVTRSERVAVRRTVAACPALALRLSPATTTP
jgi:ferredoxin